MKLLLAAVAAVLAIGLAACGDDGDDTTATTPADSKSAQEKHKASEDKSAGKSKKKRKAAESQQSKPSSGGSSSASAHAAVPPLKVSGGGSAQFRAKGGDNSIQNFGEESGESELQGAAEALHDFYVARGTEDWARACSYLTKSMAKQFEALASRSPQMKGKGCPAVLNALTRHLPPSIERQVTKVDAVSLRREDDQSFLIYRGEEGTVYAIPMTEEDGEWKVAGLAGTPLN